MRIGITGAEHVDFKDAYEKLRSIFSECKLQFGNDLIIVTGACLGVDAIAAEVACSLMLDVYTIVPGNRSRIAKNWAVYCTSSKEMPPMSTYRARNEEIVANSDILFGFPTTPEKIDGQYTRSGTWQTVRIGRRANIQVIITTLEMEKSKRERWKEGVSS